jgi:hypothetical protein
MRTNGRLSTTHRELVAVARRHAPSVLLPVLSRVSAGQLLGQFSPDWPEPWLISAIARENLAYGNEHRGGPRVTNSDLRRMRGVGLNLTDPFEDEVGQPDAADSIIVRYAFQQAPYRCDPFAEITRVLAVLNRDYSSMTLKKVSNDWESLLGLPLEKFVKAAFLILTCALFGDGWFDPAELADPKFESYGVTSAEVLGVFHRYFAAGLPDLRERARADRHRDERLRRLDFNPLVETPYVSIGDGRYLAPSMHLATQRISLASLYFIGMDKWGNAFSEDLGKIIEAYVGDQLRLLDPPAVVTGECSYKIKKNKRMTADYVLRLDGVTVVFEVKSARVAHKARLAFNDYRDDFERDVSDAFGRQIKTTVELIRAEKIPDFVDLQLPMDIRGVVVTAEPHYMINSAAYRQRLPDPGCPFAVVSLGELERLIAAAQAGDAAELFRAVTKRGSDVTNVIAQHTQKLGVEVEPNSILDAAFSRLRVSNISASREPT